MEGNEIEYLTSENEVWQLTCDELREELETATNTLQNLKRFYRGDSGAASGIVTTLHNGTYTSNCCFLDFLSGNNNNYEIIRILKANELYDILGSNKVKPHHLVEVDGVLLYGIARSLVYLVRNCK